MMCLRSLVFVAATIVVVAVPTLVCKTEGHNCDVEEGLESDGSELSLLQTEMRVDKNSAGHVHPLKPAAIQVDTANSVDPTALLSSKKEMSHAETASATARAGLESTSSVLVMLAAVVLL